MPKPPLPKPFIVRSLLSSAVLGAALNLTILGCGDDRGGSDDPTIDSPTDATPSECTLSDGSLSHIPQANTVVEDGARVIIKLNSIFPAEITNRMNVPLGLSRELDGVWTTEGGLLPSPRSSEYQFQVYQPNSTTANYRLLWRIGEDYECSAPVTVKLESVK